MGFATYLVLGALTLGGQAPAGDSTRAEAPAPTHRFLQLEAGAVVVEGDAGLYLSFPARAAGFDQPLDVVVTGLAAGVAPFELGRGRFEEAGSAWALVRHDELAVWDQVVVTWARPRATGPAQGGFLARVVGSEGRAGLEGTDGLSEVLLAGPALAVAMQEPSGPFSAYKCPKNSNEACTVHVLTMNPVTGKLEDNEIVIQPKQQVLISASLPAAHYCDGCE